MSNNSWGAKAVSGLANFVGRVGTEGLAICGGLVLCVISGSSFMYRGVRGQHPFYRNRTLSPRATNSFRVAAAATLGAVTIAVVPATAVPESIRPIYEQAQSVVPFVGASIGLGVSIGLATTLTR
jgi:hypothetical protein